MKKTVLLLTILIILSSCSKGDSAMGGKYPKPDKVCAITFDDGPSSDSELTPLVLDKLKKYNVKATFFLVGQNLNDSTESVVKRMTRNGHELANHSWSYDDMSGLSANDVKKSVDDTSAAIKKYSGKAPTFFRAPNLSTSSTMYKAIDMPFASGVLGFDWPGGGGDSPESISEKVLSGMQDGAIILLHDVQPKPHSTPAALDILIPELKKQGYEFVTLSELFKRKGIKPDSKSEMMYVYVE